MVKVNPVILLIFTVVLTLFSNSRIMAAPVLFLVGNTTLSTSDNTVMTTLTGMGHLVSIKLSTSSKVADTAGQALIVISSTCLSKDINTKFTNVPIPILTWEDEMYGFLKMTGSISNTNFGTAYSLSKIGIKLTTHPMAAGLSGTQTVYTASGSINWGKPGVDAQSVATLTADTLKKVIFGYTPGSTMVGMQAPARRVGFFLYDNPVMTPTGLSLFKAAITWALEQPPAIKNEVFLSPTGNDITGLGNEIAPFATFARALVKLGDLEGSINFMPGEYSDQVLYLPERINAGNKHLVVKPSGDKSTVRINYNGNSTFLMGISASNVTIQNLQFYSATQNVILIEMSARNLTIKNCLFNQVAYTSEGSSCLRIDGNLAPSLDHILIDSNIFIGPNQAALEINKPVDLLHFINNTVHLNASAYGIYVGVGNYSGIIVDNNIFNFLGFAYGNTVLKFDGKGKGTKINLNCLSFQSGSGGVAMSNHLSSNSILDLQLPFRSLERTSSNPGASVRGPCFDIYTQEKLSVLKNQ